MQNGWRFNTALGFVAIGALPSEASGTFAVVLAARYGADRGAVALMVMQSSLLGLVTLPLWSVVAARLAGV